MSTERDMLNSKEGCEALLSRYGTLGAIARKLGYRSHRSIRGRFRKLGVKYDARPGYNNARSGVQQDVERHTTEPPVSTDSEARAAIAEERKRLKAEHDKRVASTLLKRVAIEDMIIDTVRAAIVPFEPLRFPAVLKHPLHFDEEIPILLVSDTHPDRITPSYNGGVFRQRMRNLAVNAMSVLEMQRKSAVIKKVVIAINGDAGADGETLFPGHPFAIEQGAMDQVYRSSIPAFCELLGYVMTCGFEVEVWGCPGNHGRVSKDSAPSTNWDRMFLESLRLAAQNWKIKWIFPDSWEEGYICSEVNKNRILMHHGDPIKMHLSIPWYGIERAAAGWGDAIKGKTDDLPAEVVKVLSEYRAELNWRYLLLGHFHSLGTIPLNGRKRAFMNGAFTTDDPWVLKVLKRETKTASQWMIGIHEERIAWLREIDLLKRAEWPE